MHESLEIPQDLEQAALVAKNGERLWPLEQAMTMARWLADRGLGILGGEVYERHDVGWGTYVTEWITTPDRGSAEGWSAYVQRGKAQALAALLKDGPGSTGDSLGNLGRLYFIAFCTEDAYPDEPRRGS